jgi:hypothetical protein
LVGLSNNKSTERDIERISRLHPQRWKPETKHKLESKLQSCREIRTNIKMKTLGKKLTKGTGAKKERKKMEEK